MSDRNMAANASRPGNPKSHRRWRRLLILAMVALGGFFLYCKVRENWHGVSRDLFRSGQLGPNALKSRIARHRLRAVINLRGANPQMAWYREEKTAAAEAGIQHFDFRANSQLPPSAEELRELVHLFDKCEKPLLVHCESGIDRSGPAAAVGLLLLDESGSLEKALEQFSLWYGHLPGRANVGRQRVFLALYQEWLEQAGYDHCPDRFRHWALEVYVRPAELGEEAIRAAQR